MREWQSFREFHKRGKTREARTEAKQKRALAHGMRSGGPSSAARIGYCEACRAPVVLSLAAIGRHALRAGKCQEWAQKKAAALRDGRLGELS